MVIISEIFQLILLLVTGNIIISRIITDMSGLPFQLLVFSLTSTPPIDELFGEDYLSQQKRILTGSEKNMFK